MSFFVGLSETASHKPNLWTLQWILTTSMMIHHLFIINAIGRSCIDVDWTKLTASWSLNWSLHTSSDFVHLFLFAKPCDGALDVCWLIFFESEITLICITCWCHKWCSSSWQITSISALCYICMMKLTLVFLGILFQIVMDCLFAMRSWFTWFRDFAVIVKCFPDLFLFSLSIVPLLSCFCSFWYLLVVCRFPLDLRLYFCVTNMFFF